MVDSGDFLRVLQSLENIVRHVQTTVLQCHCIVQWSFTFLSCAANLVQYVRKRAWRIAEPPFSTLLIYTRPIRVPFYPNCKQTLAIELLGMLAGGTTSFVVLIWTFVLSCGQYHLCRPSLRLWLLQRTSPLPWLHWFCFGSLHWCGITKFLSIHFWGASTSEAQNRFDVLK